MAWKIIQANAEGAIYNSEFKRQSNAITEHGFFDPTKNFSFEFFFQVHIKLHEIYAAALDPVPEWRKINAFTKRIKCTQLQDDYCGIKDGAIYQNFIAL